MYLKLITNTPYPQFDIFEDDNLVVRIKIDEIMQALRITCKNNRRVFFITEEKVKKSSIWQLVNEYSQPLGVLAADKSAGNVGDVEIESLKMSYQLNINPVNEIVLSQDNSGAILNCRLSDSVVLEFKQYVHYFIFALSWYIFLSKEKKKLCILQKLKLIYSAIFCSNILPVNTRVDNNDF